MSSILRMIILEKVYSWVFFFFFPFSFKIKYNFYVSVEVVGPFTLSEIIYMIENLLSSYLSYLSFFSFLPVLLRSVFKLFYSRSGGVIITESTVQLLSCGVPTERPGMTTSGSPTWLVAVWLSPHSLHISPTCGSSRHYSDYNSPGIAFLLALQSFSSMTTQRRLQKILSGVSGVHLFCTATSNHINCLER